jgi:hypothetical protein
MSEPIQDNQPGPGPSLHEQMTVDGGRELLLVKQGQRYVFRCAQGQESQLLDQIIEMARDTESDIQWFDAAMLSHQLGTRMADQLERVRQTHDPMNPDT